MKIPLYKQDGSKAGEIDAPENVFGHKPNTNLVHKMLILQQTNRRQPIAHTKEKGEVRGGGRKPFRQKGTGNARQGSRRNPHMRGGGVAFGPRNSRTFLVRAPKKERQKALLCALSGKFAGGSIAALESYAVSGERPKTKDFAAMLNKLPFERTVLFVSAEANQELATSSRNIPRVKHITVQYLNIDDILKYQQVVFLKDAVEKLKERFSDVKVK